MYDRTYDPVEENNAPSHPEQGRGSNKLEQFAREKKPLPENVTEYIQKARDELKEYEEHKKFYETRRKKEIILDLATLLEEHRYPKDLFRSILARELGDYISTRYIEKILAEKYPNNTENEEQSTSQIANSSRNNNKIPIEVSSTGESIVIGDKGKPDNANPYLHKECDINSEVPTEIEASVEQVERGTEDIVRALQTQVRDLQTKCSHFEDLANESLMWKEKAIQLQRELKESKPTKMKIIKGETEIELGPELLPLMIALDSHTLGLNRDS
jgi:hypothetical protein